MRSHFAMRPGSFAGRACARRHLHEPIVAANAAAERARAAENRAQDGLRLKNGIAGRESTRGRAQPPPPRKQGAGTLAGGGKHYLQPGVLAAPPLRPRVRAP